MLSSGQDMDYHTVINDFIAKNQEIRKHELQDEDREAMQSLLCG